MIKLFYDTETTGTPVWNRPSDAKFQPHNVEIAGLLEDADGNRLSSMALLVRPDGWDIPQESIEVHGITEAIAKAGGVAEAAAAMMLFELAERADLLVGHSEAFDRRMVRSALKRAGRNDLADAWKEMPGFCTQIKSTKLCNLPPTKKMLAANRHNPKPPKLKEAYRHFTGKEFEAGHRAMYDVMATKTVYYAVIAHGEDSNGPLAPAAPPKNTPQERSGTAREAPSADMSVDRVAPDPGAQPAAPSQPQPGFEAIRPGAEDDENPFI